MNIQYDPKTKRFTAKEEKAEPAKTESIRVASALVANLTDFAKQDGFDLEGTNQGKAIKRNKVIRLYAEQALEEFIKGRK